MLCSSEQCHEGWLTFTLGPAGWEMVMKPLEAAVGCTLMVLLPLAMPKTACACPLGLMTLTPDGATCNIVH